MNQEFIPIISLIIALLSVFFWPLVSYYIAKNQFSLTLKQINAPLDLDWINRIKKLVSEISAKTLHYFVTQFDDRKDAEYYSITLLIEELKIFINPKDIDHQGLIDVILECIDLLNWEHSIQWDEEFIKKHPKIIEYWRKIIDSKIENLNKY